MFKLIIADIKVLGHRLWIIPVGAFILVSIISLIPNVNMPDSVRYFMIALLAPCLLIFELLNEDQKRNSDTMMMTMPVSKRVYVLSKYLTVVILTLTAIPAGWLSNLLHILIQGNEFSLAGSLSFFSVMLNTMGPILLLIYFILPIYYYSKRLKTSILVALLMFGFFLFGLFDVIYEYFYSHFLTEDISNFIYSFFAVLIIFAFIHLVIKFFFKSVSSEWIRIGWFAVILMLSIITFVVLTNNLDSIYVINSLLQKLETATGADRERYLNLINDFKYYISVFSISLILCVTTLIIIIKKSKKRFYQICVLYLFSPMIILTLIMNVSTIFQVLFDEKGYLGFILEYQSYYFIMPLSLIVIIAISAKSSIYLLKNNRTL